MSLVLRVVVDLVPGFTPCFANSVIQGFVFRKEKCLNGNLIENVTKAPQNLLSHWCSWASL